MEVERTKEAGGGEEARKEILKVEVERSKEAESRRGSHKENLKNGSSKEQRGGVTERKPQRKSEKWKLKGARRQSRGEEARKEIGKMEVERSKEGGGRASRPRGSQKGTLKTA